VNPSPSHAILIFAESVVIGAALETARLADQLRVVRNVTAAEAALAQQRFRVLVLTARPTTKPETIAALLDAARSRDVPAVLFSDSDFQPEVEGHGLLRAPGPTELVRVLRRLTSTERVAAPPNTFVMRAQRLETSAALTLGLVHDFNNLLTAISANASLARMKLGDRHPAYESVIQIEQATQRAAELVGQLLRMSRDEPFVKRLVDLEALVRESLRLLGAWIKPSIVIRAEFEAEAAIVQGDPTQLHQVVLNLATNAVHALEQRGGTLCVRVERVELDSELITRSSELPPGTYTRLVVSDTGPGIPEADLERIFEPFFTTRQPGKGSGLGLAVVAAIVRSHGGGVTVESAVGRGSTFHVYLPLI
jgi:signal transduction histidine kinase